MLWWCWLRFWTNIVFIKTYKTSKNEHFIRWTNVHTHFATRSVLTRKRPILLLLKINDQNFEEDIFIYFPKLVQGKSLRKKDQMTNKNKNENKINENSKVVQCVLGLFDGAEGRVKPTNFKLVHLAEHFIHWICNSIGLRTNIRTNGICV